MNKHIKLIKDIYILFIMLLYAFSSHAANDSFKILNINVWSAMTSKELKEKADSLYYKQQHPDSAMVLYTILSNRFESVKNHADEAKISIESMTKLGILYDMYIHNYAKSYAYYNRALHLSKEYGMKENLAHTTICMAGIYMSLSTPDKRNKYSEEAIDLLKKAYWTAVKIKSWKYALLAANNMMICAYSHNMFDMIQYEMDNMYSLPIPASDKYYVSTKYFYDSFHALYDKRYKDALKYMRNYKKNNKNADIYVQSNYYSMVAETYFLMGKYELALKNMEQIRKLVTAHGNNDKNALMQINMEEAKYYEGMGDTTRAMECKLKAYELKNDLSEHEGFSSIRQIMFINQLDSATAMVNKLESDKKMQETIICIVCVVTLILLVMLSIVVTLNRRLKENHKKLYQRMVEMLREEDMQKSTKLKARSATVAETQAITEAPASEQENDTKPKYQNNVLTEEHKDIILSKIRETMSDAKMICDENFGIKSLCTAIEEKQSNVSQVINERCGCNFHTLLNEYRIKEACRRIKDSSVVSSLTIEAIANGVGIKSRSHFAIMFKRVVGINPSEYLKIAKANKA